MPRLDGRVVRLVHDPDDQLCLPQGHLGVKTTSVHGPGIEVAATANVAVHLEGALDG